MEVNDQGSQKLIGTSATLADSTPKVHAYAEADFAAPRTIPQEIINFSSGFGASILPT